MKRKFLVALSFCLTFIGSTAISSRSAVADDRPACVLEVIYDANTPPWLFWLFKAGTTPCAGGVSACLTKEGNSPPASRIEEGDIFTGVCWDKLPKGNVQAVNSRIIDEFFINVIFPLLGGPTFLP